MYQTEGTASAKISLFNRYNEGSETGQRIRLRDRQRPDMGPVGHKEEAGFYSKHNRKPLKVLKLRFDMI